MAERAVYGRTMFVKGSGVRFMLALAMVVGLLGAVGTVPGGDQPEAGTPPAVGDDVILVYRGGARIEAMLIETSDTEIVVDVAGLEIRVRRSDVEELIRLPPVEERFRQRRALLADDAVDARLDLAQWAIDRGLYAEAVREVEAVMQREPRNSRAQRMFATVRELIKLRAEEARRRAERAEAGEDESEEDQRRSERRPPPERIVDFPLLTREQINLMKVYEIDLRDPPRVRIDRETVQELLNRYAGHPLLPTTAQGKRAFLAKDSLEILDVMFRIRARDLYPEVRVLGNPRSMERFRTWVNSGWLVNACATPRCHGGVEAGRLILYNRARGSEQAAYTNFLILDRFRTETGQPLLDYQEPARSLVLEMGLQREEAIVPHPDVPGWRAIFPSRRSLNFQRAVEWISGMYEPRPDYPIEYEPPTPETVRTEPVGQSRSNQ